MTNLIKFISTIVLLMLWHDRCFADNLSSDEIARQGGKVCEDGYREYALQIGDIGFHKIKYYGQHVFRATRTSSVKAIRVFDADGRNNDGGGKNSNEVRSRHDVIVILNIVERTYIGGKWHKWDTLVPICQAQYREGVWAARTGTGLAIYTKESMPEKRELPPGWDAPPGDEE